MHQRFARSLATRGLQAACAMLIISLAVPVAGQTDYYNTDAGRPLAVEDAYPIERYAFELQLAPVRLERTRGGVYRWGIEPEIAYGILPRTQIEIGAPLSYIDGGGSGSRRSGLAGLEIAVLHNLNIETSIPALAIAGDVLLPVGGFGPDRAVFSAKAIATRTFRWARFHLNGQYSFGDGRKSGSSAAGENAVAVDGERAAVSRWLAGLSADRTFPLSSMLIGAEVFARKAAISSSNVEWNTAIGVRYQLSPKISIDGGVGKQLTGDEQSWFVTFGLSRAFAIRSLLPGH